MQEKKRYESAVIYRKVSGATSTLNAITKSFTPYTYIYVNDVLTSFEYLDVELYSVTFHDLITMHRSR